MLSGKRIILGITGGIAAYKAAVLLRAFQKAGAEVRVTMTPAATRFVGSKTFAALTGHAVPIHIFPAKASNPQSWTQHIDWGEWADIFVIAPCTANTLSKIAHGQSDNMLTATVLAARCPLLICPTMDGKMFESPAVQNNMQCVRSFGYHVLQPDTGYLASGHKGKGRLPETNDILKKTGSIVTDLISKEPLSGKKVLVTAGPTREHIDAVRFISNPSSGKMGFAMAETARDMGGDVTLLHGPVTINTPDGIKIQPFTTAEDLFSKVKAHANADIIIMVAAVSDFTPAKTHAHKIKKDDATTSIQLNPTPDILAWLGQNKRDGQLLIGFAMETEKLLDHARKKLYEKKLDWIVANKVNGTSSGFAVDTNEVQLINHSGARTIAGTKKAVAREVLRHIFLPSEPEPTAPD